MKSKIWKRISVLIRASTIFEVEISDTLNLNLLIARVNDYGFTKHLFVLLKNHLTITVGKDPKYTRFDS